MISEKGVDELIKEYKELYNELIRLQQENQQLKEEIARLKKWKEDLLNENIELESIRKEAIEYIEERFDGEVFTHTFDKCNMKELLKILGDKENENNNI